MLAIIKGWNAAVEPIAAGDSPASKHGIIEVTRVHKDEELGPGMQLSSL